MLRRRLFVFIVSSVAEVREGALLGAPGDFYVGYYPHLLQGSSLLVLKRIWF